MKNLFLVLLIIYHFPLIGQSIFYQDVFKGGVCVTGTATGNSGSPFVDVPYYIEGGSSIRKIFMITYEGKPYTNHEAFDYDFILDGIPINQNNTSNITVNATNLVDPTNWQAQRNHIVDITNSWSPSGSFIHIEVPYHETPIGCPGCHYSAPVLVIMYNNPLLPELNVSLYLNDVVNDDTTHINNLTGFNPILQGSDVGMGVHSDRLGGLLVGGDGFSYFINDQYIGYNDTVDSMPFGSTMEAGVIGTYYYQNGSLIGLTDDIANNQLSASDGILRLNNYIGSSLNPLTVDFNYIETPGVVLHNILVGLYFAYSTPCEPFDVSTSSDTTICEGVPIQLSASSSNPASTFEWQPATGLSCTNCPNPILTADSTRLYTVQIFNNDSCSVIRPVMIHVRKKPIFSNVAVQPTVCGSSTGVITISAPTAVSYSINSGTWQSGSTFSNLAEGAYTVSIQDVFGCENDTLINVGYVNETNALFNVNPNTGSAPLNVDLTNNSINATIFQWFINNQPYLGDLTNYTFDTSGVYSIQLIAINNFAYCVDSLTLTILVYDSLIVTIPNVFTPNGDGINDFYTITSNQDVNYNFHLLNRWGNEMANGSGDLKANIPKTIWDSSLSSFPKIDGVYFLYLDIVDSTVQKYNYQQFITIKN